MGQKGVDIDPAHAFLLLVICIHVLLKCVQPQQPTKARPQPKVIQPSSLTLQRGMRRSCQVISPWWLGQDGCNQPSPSLQAPAPPPASQQDWRGTRAGRGTCLGTNWRARHLQRTRWVTHIWLGEAGEVQAQARFLRSSQTGLEARPRAALHDGAKSVPGSAPPVCLCKDPALAVLEAARGWHASLEAQTQLGARCRAYFVSCSGRGLSHGLAVHLRDPEPPGRAQPAAEL